MKLYRYLKLSHNKLFKLQIKSVVEVIKSETPLFCRDSLIPLPENKLMWSHYFYPRDKKITLPVFDLKNNEYSGDNVVLNHDIFNQILRKDIIHKVMIFNREYNRKTFKWVKSKGDVAGSNRKPFQQKKTGRAPQGDIRAPNMYHGGRAHGARPRSFYFPLNKKIRLLGLKCMLTSKFIENKLIIVSSDLRFDNESLAFLKENKTLLITKNQDEFDNKGLKYLLHCNPEKLNVMHLLSVKYLILTVDGLNQLTDLLISRNLNYFRNKKLPLDPNKTYESSLDKYKFDFDPNSPLRIYTPILKGSFKQIKYHYNNPDVIVKRVEERKEKERLDKIRLKEENKKKLQESLYDDDTVLEKRRLQIKKEKRMKLLKEQNKKKLAIKKAIANKQQAK